MDRTTSSEQGEALRAEMLAQYRRWRETPDTPEQVAERQERIAQMRQVAKEADTDTRLIGGGLALIQQMDASKPDHIALAIGAHRLLWLSVRADLDTIGQAAAEQPRLLTLLILYLDDCGWHWHGNGMQDDYDPCEIAAEIAARLSL